MLVPPTIAALSELHQELDVSFHELEPPGGLAALRAWQTDVPLIDDLTVTPSQIDVNVETIQITTDTLYAMLPAAHPLAAKKFVQLAD